MSRLEKRWDARRTGLEPISCEVSTTVAASRERVWTFLVHPRSAQLLDPTVVKAFRVPGTPMAGVGEQHCTVLRQGDILAAHLTELVAIDAPRSIGFRSLTVPGGFLSSYGLEEVHGGCLLTYRVEGQVAAGSGAAAERAARSNATEALTMLRAVVESGAILPPPD